MSNTTPLKPLNSSKISVVIPTLNAGDEFERLLQGLESQSRTPDEVLVIDSSSTDQTPDIAVAFGARVVTIAQSEFNHGGTRNRAARMASGDLVVFMTQDAFPADDQFIEALSRDLVAGQAAATYARQIPRADATAREEIARLFNYPETLPESQTVETDGVESDRAFFSNVASAVRVDAFEAAGGFPEDTVFSEDMIFSGKLLQLGYSVRYAPDARVIHSHNYSPLQQFRRYFDIGTAYRNAEGTIGRVKTGQRGLRFALSQQWQLLERFELVEAVAAAVEVLAKALGFYLGRNHDRLPLLLRRRFSMNPWYWDGRNS